MSTNKEKKKTTTTSKVYKPKKLIVPKWKLFRANEPLLSVFMWGINHSINELSHVPPPKLLLPDDFKASSKITVDNHLFNKEHMPSHFKYKEYCPNVFRNLREKFGVAECDYLKSFTKYQPAPSSSSSSSSNNAARFYQSYDKMFVVKALCAEQLVKLHSVLPEYYEYVVEKHGKTLLPQYLGMYRLTVEGSETYWVVMRNIFGGRYSIHKKFDLKGSTVQRQASGKERMKELPTFKDNDFLDEGYKLYLPDEAKQQLLEMLASDTTFLAKLHLMDYSLLVGIHELGVTTTTTRTRTSDSSDADAEEGSGGQPTPPASPVLSSRTAGGGGDPQKTSSRTSDFDEEGEFYAVQSRPGAPKKVVYLLGLVDILTYYGVKKMTASAAKTVKYGAEAEISTVKPDQYARRMVEFVTKALEA